MKRFVDRNEAGRRLAVHLKGYAGRPDALVMALPRGGVPVGYEVARALGLGLDLFPEVPDAASPPTDRLYRGALGPLFLEGRTAILVDDGRASFASLVAAVRALERRGPRRIVVALPVASREVRRELRIVADEVVCAEKSDTSLPIGLAYEWFPQVSEEQVRRCMAHCPRSRSAWEELPAFRIAV